MVVEHRVDLIFAKRALRVEEASIYFFSWYLLV